MRMTLPSIGVRYCIYASVLLVFGCSKTNGIPSSPIIAVVNDDNITLEEFQRAFRGGLWEEAIDGDTESVRMLKRSLLDQLIEQRLFLAEARRLKLELPDAVLQRAINRVRGDYEPGEFEAMLNSQQTRFEEWKDHLREELLAQEVINQAVPEQIEITNEEIKAYYEKHREEFIHPEEVRSRQLVVASEETADMIRARLMEGADFSKLARTHSLSPDRDQGGDLGFFSRGEMPEEFDIVFTLEVGQISPIVKTPYGYHLFKIEERHPSNPMEIEERNERIRAQLTRERREMLFTAWVVGLKKNARITINDRILFQNPDSAGAVQEVRHG